MTLIDRPAPVESAPLSHADLVAALRSEFTAGRTRTLSWRRAQLEAMRRMLTEGEQELLVALAADLGKPGIEGWMTEVQHVRNEIADILRHLDRWARPDRVPVRAVMRPARAHIVPEPLGVTLVIAPWNYPVHLLLLPMAYAIAAGNAVVGKPSEVSAATSAALVRLVPRYLDPAAVAIVPGDADVVTSLLDQRWDYIFYTGNGRIGRLVMQAAAKNLTPVTLELGGKSPAIVDRSAKIDVAARRIAWGKMVNAGQTCVAPDYVLVDHQLEERLIQALERAIKDFYGDDPSRSSDYSRIINERHWDRLMRLITDNKDKVVLGGEGDRQTRYLAPTILRGVGWEDSVMGEEIFGPILPVIPVEGHDEAIEMVNSHDKPLALYVFAEDQEVIDRVVDGTSSGGVGANVTLMHLAVSDLPFGGVGESGMGAYHGKAGFDTFSHRKAVLQRPTSLDPSLTYPPYSRLKEFVLRRFF